MSTDLNLLVPLPLPFLLIVPVSPNTLFWLVAGSLLVYRCYYSTIKKTILAIMSPAESEAPVATVTQNVDIV